MKLLQKLKRFGELRATGIPPKPGWMDEDWAKDHIIETLYPNPYPSKEVPYYWVKRFFGPFNRNKNIVDFLPKTAILNDIGEAKKKIGFIGDIMVMEDDSLEFSDEIVEFFSDVDLVVGNFEGTLTIQPRFVLSRRHNETIMDQLSSLVNENRNRLLIGVANNHSGDFGFADYILSINRLAWAGFNVFGRKDIASFRLDKINIVTGTQWSDQKDCAYIPRINPQNPEVERYRLEDHFNILYPHWGYELEYWPRPSQIQFADDLLDSWDLIFGHHPHLPQPITVVEIDGIKKLLCYSGGNICTNTQSRFHKWGLIAKCEIGPLQKNPNQLATGRVDWNFIQVNKLAKKLTPKGCNGKNMKVQIVEDIPKFRGCVPSF